ncbi:MAG: 5'/3'-nucleotidase SurE [Clostridia bacterium]|nr:5'/3'-nucleotidase SurE [Clostridia bacterium]
MRILITNDDGIMSPVMPELVRWARGLGEVTVVAPKVEQSGKSHAIDFTRPIEIKEVAIADDVTVWSMDSTPADCVRFAILGMKLKPDLIISGINRGFNLGKDIVYSGTCGAIFEGARLGIKGIALSTDPKGFAPALKRLDSLWSFIVEKKLLDKNNLYNINIPPEDKGIVYTRQGGIYFYDEFVCIGNDMYEQRGGLLETDSCDLTLDTDAIRNGYLSITPLTHERTNLEVFRELNDK